jgi:hypothetical protein
VFSQLLYFLRSPVVGGHFMSVIQKTPGHIHAHPAQSDHAYFHTVLLSALPPANLKYFLPQGGQKMETCRIDQ